MMTIEELLNKAILCEEHLKKAIYINNKDDIYSWTRLRDRCLELAEKLEKQGNGTH